MKNLSKIALLLGFIFESFRQRNPDTSLLIPGLILPGLILPGLFVLGSTQSALAQYPSRLTEYQVKAAFIYKFALFVEWPREALPDSSTPVTLGIFGKDPFGAVLEETLANQKIGGRSISILRLTDYQKIRKCQILFISHSETRRWPRIFEHLKTAPILTIGEAEGFAQKGGIINFFNADNKIRFEINHSAAKAHQLQISSKLLRLAKIVE